MLDPEWTAGIDAGIPDFAAQVPAFRAWVWSSGILALGALFRGFENAWRFRACRIRASLGWASSIMGAWAGLAALQGEIAGIAWVMLCLLGTAESVLAKGLEQGGSDPMTLWLRAFVAAAAFASSGGQYVLTVLGGGVLLASYLCAGLGKVRAASWWDGRALQAYLARPCYTQTESLLRLFPCFAYRWLGMFVLAFELLSPSVLMSRSLLWGWVLVGISFHLANAGLFGLHRFFWTWVAAYPLLFVFVR